MKWLWRSFVGRNALGLSALLLAHNVVYDYILRSNTDWTHYVPYLFLILMYGWIVLHNRILFERLFLRGNHVAYFGWLGSCMLVGTVNMALTIKYLFNVDNVLPHLLRYYSDTVTGLGVFVTYRHLTTQRPPESTSTLPANVPEAPPAGPPYLTCLVDGESRQIPHGAIRYIEGLENYIKIITPQQTHIVRMTLKEAESRLPKPPFVRISKSHIVNLQHAHRLDADHLQADLQTLRIGRVYKRYVSEQV
jgi:hypothetical protein